MCKQGFAKIQVSIVVQKVLRYLVLLGNFVKMVPDKSVLQGSVV